VTRSDLALETGLTCAAVRNITRRLLRERLILPAGQLRGGRRGPPSTKFVVNPESCFSVGFDIDRDHITLILLDLAGKIRARSSHEIHSAKPATVRTFYQRAVHRMLEKVGIDHDNLVGVGVALPGDVTRAVLPYQPADYADWTEVRADELIRYVLGIPVFVENDATAAAIGELQFGSGQRLRSFFYLLINAGLGGGASRKSCKN
jgi:predicted NBD/HSP70 family sugar kinase